MANQNKNDNRSHWIAGGVTFAVMGSIILVCCLVKMYAPDPPIPESGVEVALGYDESGLGEMSSASSEPNYSAPAAAGEYATQSTEQSVAMPSNSRGTKTNPNAKPNETAESKEPQLNPNAVFKGRTNPNASGQTGQGNTTGNGQMGNPNGTPGATNYKGNGGVGFSLLGRSAVSLPEPSYNSSREGKIVVKIWVDKQGMVTRTHAPEQGSTLTDVGLVSQCERAARSAHFNASATAAEVQTGTITYVFRRTN